MFRRKTFEALTQKKMKKILTERNRERDRRGRQKNEEQGLDSSYFLLKNDFQSVRMKQARNQKYSKNRFD